MEVNGKLSFLPNEPDRPLTPRDMQLTPAQSRPPIAIIMDGVLLQERLRMSGNTESWLRSQLQIQGYRDETTILLALVDDQNNLSIYQKTSDEPSPVTCG